MLAAILISQSGALVGGFMCSSVRNVHLRARPGACCFQFFRIALAGVCALFLLQCPDLWGQSAAPAQFELHGKVVRRDGKPFRDTRPDVILHSAAAPFMTRTRAGRNGGFRFKRLPQGNYVLIVVDTLAGELRKSIEIGPSFADSEQRIKTLVQFDRTVRRSDHGVSAAELSIPEAARKEYAKAEQRLAAHDAPAAVSHLDRAVEIAPQFASAWNNLGAIAYQEKDYERAEECFREALKHDPRLFPPLVNLGGTLLSQRKLDEALETNITAVAQNPNDALAQAQLGQSYYYLEQLDRAEVHLRKAKTLDPNHVSYPQLLLSKVYQRLKQPAAAVRELQEFLALHPDSKLVPYVRRQIDVSRAMHQEPRFGWGRGVTPYKGK
jgi:tetratricopeptide (TPR) repeat protein